MVFTFREVEAQRCVEAERLRHERAARFVNPWAHSAEADVPGAVDHQWAGHLSNAGFHREVPDFVAQGFAEEGADVFPFGLFSPYGMAHGADDQAPRGGGEDVIGEDAISLSRDSAEDVRLDAEFFQLRHQGLMLPGGLVEVEREPRRHVGVVGGGLLAQAEAFGGNKQGLLHYRRGSRGLPGGDLEEAVSCCVDDGHRGSALAGAIYAPWTEVSFSSPPRRCAFLSPSRSRSGIRRGRGRVPGSVRGRSR